MAQKWGLQNFYVNIQSSSKLLEWKGQNRIGKPDWVDFTKKYRDETHMFWDYDYPVPKLTKGQGVKKERSAYIPKIKRAYWSSTD